MWRFLGKIENCKEYVESKCMDKGFGAYSYTPPDCHAYGDGPLIITLSAVEKISVVHIRQMSA